MRECEGCGVKMPAFKPRQRNENGDLLCEGCTNDRPGRPVGHHGARLACQACGTPMGEGGLVVTAGVMRCPDGCKTAASDEINDCPTCHGTGKVDGKICPSCYGDGEETDGDRAVEHMGSLRKKAHDSGDGATIFHCPFCGAGQVTARSDGTVECGFCNTYFTVQVQPQHAAMPQTDPKTGQPLNMPGMPGDPASHVAPTPEAKPEDPGFAPEGTGGDEGFAPAGTKGAQFLPAGTGNHVGPAKAASRKTALEICPGTNQQAPDFKMEGKGAVGSMKGTCPSCGTKQRTSITGRVLQHNVEKTATHKVAYEVGDERHDPQEGDEPCTCCGGSGEHPSGHECYRCDATGLEAHAAGECDAQTLAKGALYLTPDGVAIPEKSYLAHLALRFADDRDAVLTAVRNERAAR